MKPPKTLAAATALLAHYAQVEAQRAEIEAKRVADIAKINADADAKVGPLVKELEEIQTRLKPWWDANGAELAKTRKSAELGGCIVGYAKSRTKLVHRYNSDDEAVEALRGTRLFKKTTKEKHSLDRTATLKLIQIKGKTAELLVGLGFKVEEGVNTFYVERSDPAATLAG